MNITKVQKELAGKIYTLETGRVANQANGSVILTCGDTMIMATACMSAQPREGMNFFPLTCDFEERKYAVGKIPGGFIKRGGRPSEKAVLTSRLIDRPIRPLFDEGMRNDVQVIAMPISLENGAPSDVLSVTAASAALAISDIPWNGPLACVRVCRLNGEWVVNPSIEDTNLSDVELIIAGADGKVMEIEMEAAEVTEEELAVAIDLALESCQVLIELQNELVKLIGKPKVEVPVIMPAADLIEEIGSKVNADIQAAIRDPKAGGKESAIFDLRDQLAKKMAEEYPERVAEIAPVMEKLIKKQVRNMILVEGARADGRALDEIRELKADVGLLPRVHGSGLFSRGQTQVLTAVTLGSLDDSQMIDNLEEDTEKRFMHFYNFPPYSVGEVRPLRGAGRREVGHGALAEKALRPMIPTTEEFPYTILMTSDVLESNGSSSMASTCGCTLALMDAGVKIKEPVAGISIGLVSDGDKAVLLTDIQGLEDFTGDMDFKVAGTKNGITAIQVDTKTSGLSREIVLNSLAQAKTARLKILEVIFGAVPEVRAEMSQYAPRVIVMEINPEKIGEVIGPGGKVIKRIEAETGAKMDIEQSGKIYITCVDAEGGEKARKIIEGITGEIEVGAIYTGKVNRIEAFGAFVEILPGKDGLAHISQLAPNRVNKVEDVLSMGQEIKVRVIEVGDDGKVKLSRRGLIEGDEDYVFVPPPPGGSRPSFGGGRPGGGGGRPSFGGGGGGRPPYRPDAGRSDANRPDSGRDRFPKRDDDEGPKVTFRPKN